ncbi:potassium channel family protein [Oceanospirillum sediminis]|uniref:Potassium channel family protein n=1 Tax=Oceanospirillum sediminis TaxID=2760088 RepID=A0A839IL80_9GAMM|nr:potassium channel family protein [Oceanospirillum sediminis]MBB1485302.1 potassium channel family protein [Oceanospirillum sediminis]
MNTSAPTSANTLRYRCYQLLDGEHATSLAGRLVNGFIITLIVVNVVVVIIESIPEINQQYSDWFRLLEIFSVIIFTLEYLTRLWISPENPRFGEGFRGRLRYMRSPIAIVDLIVILPFYLSLFISIDLRYLRLLRLLRLLKLSHYIRSMDVFIKVVTSELASLASAVFAVLVLVVLAACLMFTLEHQAQPEAFKTVLDAIWWAVVTMTTVGYGDITPVTAGGKILAITIMLLGVGTVALPAGMLAARFSEELQNRKSSLTAEVINALEDGELTDHEQHILKRLSHQYGISDDELNQIIRNQRLELGHKIHCPHCGKSLFESPDQKADNPHQASAGTTD